MLEDRSYMQSPTFGPRRSLTVTLLIINAVVFVLHHALQHYGIFRVDRYFALSLGGLSSGWIWQLLTFQFLHANLMHILLNSWGIYVFGRAVEDALGPKGFLTLYLGSGVVGGLVHVIGSWLLPNQFGGFGVPVVGASAGLFGLLAAFGRMFPDQRLTLLLFFIIPVTLTARMLLIVSGLIALIGIIIPTQGGVAEGAHLGGLLAGMAYVQWFRYSDVGFSMPGWMRMPRRRPRPTGGPGPTRPSKMEYEEFTPDFISREVDPILDKISAHGIQSLTERERRILDAARSKMTKR